jgi:hypothetical protein
MNMVLTILHNTLRDQCTGSISCYSTLPNYIIYSIHPLTYTHIRTLLAYERNGPGSWYEPGVAAVRSCQGLWWLYNAKCFM